MSEPLHWDTARRLLARHAPVEVVEALLRETTLKRVQRGDRTFWVGEGVTVGLSQDAVLGWRTKGGLQGSVELAPIIE
jgi:hypothetical protein